MIKKLFPRWKIVPEVSEILSRVVYRIYRREFIFWEFQNSALTMSEAEEWISETEKKLNQPVKYL